MVNKVSNGQNNCQGNDDSLSLDALTEEDMEFSSEGSYVISGSKPTRLIRLVNPHQALVFKTGHSVDYRIPKPVVSLDEKYLRGCLESIHLRASMMSGDAIVLENLIVTTPLESKGRDGFESPGVLVGPAGQWIVGSGSVLGPEVSSKSGGDFFHRHQASYPISNFDARPRALSVSTSSSTFSSPMRLDRDGCGPGTAAVDRLGHGVDPRKTPASSSSTNSSSSDRTLSPLFSTTIGQGMIKRSGGEGFQRFVFSVDDQREVYVASPSSGGEKGLDLLYSFHEISGRASRLVGEMTVSSSIAVGEDGSRLSETEFVLLSGGAASSSCAPSGKRRDGLSKKVADVFKLSKLSGPIPTRQDLDLDLDGQDREMAAVVVRAREEESCLGGGWGLKFLEKVKAVANGSGDRATRSVDVLIPAGPHGGPGARNGGSSSILERWRSGGRCDCGGWDMGCPLTLLTPKSNNEDEGDVGSLQQEFKSFDLIKQGSGHGAPKLRVVTLRDDLYFVHFERALSILQTFSIAVAIIHTRSPSLLRPKNVHELK